MMKEMLGNSYLFGSNAPFIEALYEAYLKDPQSVEPRWRGYFDELQRLDDGPRDVSHDEVQRALRRPRARSARGAPTAGQQRPAARARSSSACCSSSRRYRTLGVRHADARSAGRARRSRTSPSSTRRSTGSTDADMETVFNTGTLVWKREATLREILQFLKDTYCRTHRRRVHVHDRHDAEALGPGAPRERSASTPQYDAEYKKHILERLTAAETLEKYLHTRYVGQKRFSGEGGEIADSAARPPAAARRQGRRAGARDRHGAPRAAQRARQHARQDAEGSLRRIRRQARRPDLLAGDVKYHMGFSSNIMTPGGPMHVTLAFNPSHLEIVNPVVEGSVRARQHRRARLQRRPGAARADPRRRVVRRAGRHQETLNLAQTRGYGTGGTVHIVVNNQIGFTDFRPARRALDALLHRRREDARGADLPRQRRRSRSGLPRRPRSRSITA